MATTVTFKVNNAGCNAAPSACLPVVLYDRRKDECTNPLEVKGVSRCKSLRSIVKPTRVRIYSPTAASISSI